MDSFCTKKTDPKIDQPLHIDICQTCFFISMSFKHTTFNQTHIYIYITDQNLCV